MNKSLLKKLIIAVSVAIVISLGVETAVLFSSPHLYQNKYAKFDEATIDNVVSDDNLEFFQYKKINDTYVPTHNDPQIYVCFDRATQVATLRISFANMLKDTITVQVFYPDKNGDFYERNSVSRDLVNVDSVIFSIPESKYNLIRIDINGEFELKKIETSKVSIVSKEYFSENFNLIRMFEVFVFLALIIFFIQHRNVIPRLRKKCIKIDTAIKESPQKFIKNILLTFVIIIGLCLTVVIGLLILEKKILFIYFPFAIIVGSVISIFTIFFKHIGKRPEYFFLVLFLASALLWVIYTPTVLALVSWDDETHYSRTLQLSYFGEDARVTDADLSFISRVNQQSFSIEEQNATYRYFDEQFDQGASIENLADNNGLTYQTLVYLPSSIALFIGRILNMSFHGMLVFAKFVNAIVFAVLAFFSVKKLKTGKMILAVIALLPTNVFLASNFSYDPWITGLLMLGFSWFFSELQQPQKMITIKEWLGILIILIIGIGPKAVYFPLIAILFFMPKNKFVSDKGYRVARLCTVVGIVIVVMTFVLPIMLNGVGGGDSRGGTEVNAIEQIQYIINNPLSYVITLLKFLYHYFSIGNAQMYVTSFAYLGKGLLYGALFVLMFVVAFTDRNDLDSYITTVSKKAIIWSVALVTVVIIASVLYIMFTPVGFNTINGCQERYLIPLLFPVLYVMGSSKIDNKMNRNTYNTIIFSISGLILFINIAYNMIGRYYIYN